jgi:hypothetical protein
MSFVCTRILRFSQYTMIDSLTELMGTFLEWRHGVFPVMYEPNFYIQWTIDVTRVKPNAWGYNWVTLFLGEINTGTWPSRLGESQKLRQRNMLSAPRDLDFGLAMVSNKLLPDLSSEGAPHMNKPAVGKFGRGSQMCAWHQDRLSDWPSVVKVRNLWR